MQNQICDFRVKTKNSDFKVAEVPLLPDMDTSEKTYTYIWLKKSNHTTFKALERLKDFFRLNFDDVAAEGLKDEDGITEQLISIKRNLLDSDAESFNKENYTNEETYVSIERIVGYGSEPVHAKALHGNSFQIIIRNLTENEANTIENFVKNRKFFSFINYYDNQRFGLPGGPYMTHLIGKAICENKWDEAFEYMKQSGNEIPEGKTGKEAFKSINPNRVDFYVSSYNSFLWNNAVSDFLKKNYESRKFSFPGIGELYLPTDFANLPAGNFVVDSFYFDKEDFSTISSKFTREISLASAVYFCNKKHDEIFEGKTQISLSFFLHTGCYATMIIKQIIKQALEEAI